MKAWFDCEFCDFSDPEPISIGLVSEAGNNFYAEFPVDAERCSEFVRSRVLPQLLGDSQAPDVVARHLNAWLGLAGISVLICDTSYDEKIIRSLGVEIPIRHVKQLPKERREVLFTHHAHQDACVLRSLYP